MNAPRGLEMESASLYDVDVEQALLGAVLVDNLALEDAVAAGCVASDFMDPMHTRAWSTIVGMRDRREIVTPLTLTAAMAADAGLREVGGKAYFVSLAQAASAKPNIVDYVRIVSDLSLRRRCDFELETAMHGLRDTTRPILDCLTGVLATSAEAVDKSARSRGYQPLDEALNDVLREAERAAMGEIPPSIPTGIETLDRKLGGLQAGDVVIVAGRPGMGKTVLLTTIARAAAQALRPALLFELEMSRKHVLHRLICDADYDHRQMEKPLTYSRFRAGKARGNELDRALVASRTLARLPLEIFDTDSMTIHEIAAHTERAVARSKVMGVVVIDYLQIITPGERYAGSKTQEVTEISNAAKRLAKRVGWPVVLGCQLNREADKRPDKRPALSDLRESGAIEQDADIVIGMHRPAYYVYQKIPPLRRADPKWLEWLAEYEGCRNDMELMLLKNRHGPTGEVKCFVEIGASAIRAGKAADQDDGTGESEGQGFLV